MANEWKSEEYVYRISTAKEWHELQSTGSSFGGDLDKSTSCFHLSNLDQVKPTLERFYADSDQELYLLQVDSKKLGDGLIYEAAEGTEMFPHYYGPSRSFAPLPAEAVTRAEKLSKSGKCTSFQGIRYDGCLLAMIYRALNSLGISWKYQMIQNSEITHKMKWNYVARKRFFETGQGNGEAPINLQFIKFLPIKRFSKGITI